MPEKLITLLAIGGSDPTGGAGIQADIRAANSLGIHAVTIVTSVTVQNSRKFYAVNPVSPDIIRRQWEAVMTEVVPDAIKIGMTGSPQNCAVIGECLRSIGGDIPLVVDPVLKATMEESVESQVTENIISQYLSLIFPFATAVTPNIVEAKEILQHGGISPSHDPIPLVIELLKFAGCNSIILKGGHTHDGDIITDYLADFFNEAVVVSKSSHPRVNCMNLHGTGCLYSSLLASFLALGFPLHDSFLKTSRKVYEIISASCGYSLGDSSYGPLNITGYRL